MSPAPRQQGQRGAARHVFLDLDGTLIDPARGIAAAVNSALEEAGCAPVPAESLGWVIGPPLLESFERLGVPDPEESLAAYRRVYGATGLFDGAVYAGVREMLGGLRAAGHRLYLATAKPHVFARRVTAHFGLDAYLLHQFGPEMDGTRDDKAQLLAHAIEALGVCAAESVMIGDRHHDYRAARANNMLSLAVTWGYGNAQEWAEADRQCDSPDALVAMVGAMLPR